jgi:putative transposase
VNRFGRHFADCIRRDRLAAGDKWHLDEVVIPISGRKYWLWRAVDVNGDVLDILVQPQRKAKAARRFLVRLIDQFVEPPCRYHGQIAQLFQADPGPGTKRRSSRTQ